MAEESTWLLEESKMNSTDIEDQKSPGYGTKEDSVSSHSSSSGEQRSGEASFGPQLLAAGAATLGALALGAAIGWSSPASPQLAEPPLSLSSSDISLIGSIINIGALIGAVGGGIVINKIGRKATAIYVSPIFALGFLLVGFGNNVPMILAGRLLCGLGGGTTSVAAPVYVGEIATSNRRGLLGSGFQLMVVTGILLGYFVGAFVTWWWLSIISGFIPLMFMIAMMFVPESPVYLISKNDENGAKKALQWLRGAHYGIGTELEEIKHSIAEQNARSITFRDLFESSVLKPFLICVALMFFQQFSGINAALFNLNIIFSASGGDMDSNTQSCIVGIVQVAATVVSSVLVDRAGRKILLISSAFVMAVCLVALGVFFYFQENDPALAANLGWLPLVSLIIYIIFFSFGFGPLPWALMGELLPGHVKGLASSLVSGFNWGLAFIITLVFDMLVSAIQMYGVFWLFAGFTVLAGFFVLFLVPETKGKSLDEIQRLFS
ncbi:facilitated trehalose transporter Tret1-like isoform X2 [Artemia franciscana]|uniref:facilitated trehalose transporter Tret1-like isoform X2 n=1 Tax=Artemia franciscana TaxID=6661 RepID=UPI0032DA6A56